MREEQTHTVDQGKKEARGTERVSALNDMNHLNRILREKTQENLYLGSWNFD